MSKVKLELDSLSDDELRDNALAHSAAIAGKPLFATPEPTALVFDAAVDDFATAITNVALAEAALASAVEAKNAKRAVLETAYRGRAGYVQKTSNGEAADITSVAMKVASAKSVVSSLPQVENLAAKAGTNAGAAELSWKGKAKGLHGFTIEAREDVAGSVWAYVKGTTRSTTTVKELVSGKRYLFRVRATGAGDLVGPWSDEAQVRVP